jgi:hypothetical protein
MMYNVQCTYLPSITQHFGQVGEAIAKDEIKYEKAEMNSLMGS